VLVSFAALAEIHEVLIRKRFRRYVDEEDVRFFLAALTREAEWVDVEHGYKPAAIPRTTSFSNWQSVDGERTSSVATLTFWR
jgi:hypothetical protein